MLRTESRSRIYLAIFVFGIVGVVLLAATAPDPAGRVIGAGSVMYAALLVPCLRMRVRSDGADVLVQNGFRSTTVPLSELTGVRNTVRPNVGLLSGAWYWCLRRRTVWLMRAHGRDVRVAVFTEMPGDGEWHCVGTVDSDSWWQIAHQ